VRAQAPSALLRVLRRGGRRMLTVDTSTGLLATLLSRCRRQSQTTTTPAPVRPRRRSSTSSTPAAESLLELAAAAICTHIDSFASLDSLSPDLSQLLFNRLIRTGDLTYARLALFGGSSLASAILSGDVSSVDDAWLRRLGSAQQLSLTELECTQCAGVTDDGIAALRGCEALRSLHFANGVQLTDASVVALSPLTMLHTLSMQGCQAITANGMQRLAGKSQGKGWGCVPAPNPGSPSLKPEPSASLSFPQDTERVDTEIPTVQP